MDGMDGMDGSIRKAIWDGVVPIVFTLSPDELVSTHAPQPYYLMAPRCSYLPLLADPVREHFLKCAPVTVEEMWFDYEGQPLKWHYPIGVLFDLCASASSLPWALTVHFQGFPKDTVLHCREPEVPKNQFFSACKECNYLKWGIGARWESLSVQDSNQLWDSLKSRDYDKYWTVNESFRGSIHEAVSLAIRICRPGKPPLQRPVCPFDADSGDRRPMLSVLQELLPSTFGPSFTYEDGNVEVLVHGITPPMETPIDWLAENATHPDNWLYIVVKERK